MTAGVFPGSFDPPSIAHVEIVDTAYTQLGLDRVTCSISADPLGKRSDHQTPAAERIAALRRLRIQRPWLHVQLTDARHLADIAEGFDWLIVGADKWEQLHDVSFYRDASAMADALARLPRVAYVPRAGTTTPAPDGVTVLDVDPAMATVSSSAIRGGRDEWRALQPADVAGRPEDHERSTDDGIDGDRPEES